MNSMSSSWKNILLSFIPGKGHVFFSHAFFRPITHMSWWVDGLLWGEWVPGYRLTNLLMYAACVFLVAKVGLLLVHDHHLVWVAAAFFLWHPVHVEVLSWVSCRGDLLMFLFMMLGLWAHLALPCRWPPAIVCAFYLLALLCKESAILFPVWIVATDLLVLRKGLSLRSCTLWGTMFAIGVGYIVLRSTFLSGLGGYDHLGGSAHLDLLHSGWQNLWKRLGEHVVRSFWLPWPSLATNSTFYEPFRLLPHCLLLLGMAGWIKRGGVQFAFWLLWFIFTALFFYLPGSVVEVLPNMTNGRMLFASSFPACFFLAMGVSQVAKNSLAALCSVPYFLLFLLTFSSWEKAGILLREIPRETRSLFTKSKNTDEILFLNDDFSNVGPAILFSTIPDGFSRAFMKEFGPNHPRFDWQHPASANKFTVEYWRSRESEINKTLFFTQWDHESHRVVDRSEAILEFLARPSGIDLQMISEWNGAQIFENILDFNGLQFKPKGENLDLETTQADSWFALQLPPMCPRRIEIHWSSELPSGSPLTLGFYWITSHHKVWGDYHMTIDLASSDALTTSIDIPYTLKELNDPTTQLQAIRIDPGRKVGVFSMEKIVFYQ